MSGSRPPRWRASELQAILDGKAEFKEGMGTAGAIGIGSGLGMMNERFARYNDSNMAAAVAIVLLVGLMAHYAEPRRCPKPTSAFGTTCPQFALRDAEHTRRRGVGDHDRQHGQAGSNANHAQRPMRHRLGPHPFSACHPRVARPSQSRNERREKTHSPFWPWPACRCHTAACSPSRQTVSCELPPYMAERQTPELPLVPPSPAPWPPSL